MLHHQIYNLLPQRRASVNPPLALLVLLSACRGNAGGAASRRRVAIMSGMCIHIGRVAWRRRHLENIVIIEARG